MSTKAERSAAAAALGSKGGKANTDAQNAARAKNGRKGGRPPILCVACGEPLRDHTVAQTASCANARS